MFWKLWSVFYENTFLIIFVILKILWNILTFIFSCLCMSLTGYNVLICRICTSEVIEKLWAKGHSLSLARKPQLLHCWWDIEQKSLTNYISSFTPLYLYGVLLIQSSQYLLCICCVEFTEHCFLPSSIPYAWCNYSI